MSPSWTSRWFRDSAPKPSIGIAIGRREICAVHAVLGEKGAQVQAIHSVQLADEMFIGSPTPTTESNLTSALVKVAAEAHKKFIPCHVALPDPAIRFTVFELDELPTSDKARLELVRWRFAKEHASADQTLACTYQELGSDSNKQLLLSEAMDNAWLQCVKHALQRANIVPWSMNLGARYRFNRFHDRFAKEKHGAAMVILDPDSWSVFLWDATTRPRLARARWRNGADGGTQAYDLIALEAERSILSYVRSGKNGSIAQVYAVGDARELNELAAALDRRLREKCIPLTAVDANPNEDAKLQEHSLASLSFAATSA